MLQNIRGCSPLNGYTSGFPFDVVMARIAFPSAATSGSVLKMDGANRIVPPSIVPIERWCQWCTVQASPKAKTFLIQCFCKRFCWKSIGIEGDNGCIVDIWLSVDGYLRHGLQHGKQFFTAGGFMSKNSIDCFLPYKGNAGTQRQNTSNVQCTTFQAIRQKIWHFQFGRKTSGYRHIAVV